MVGDQAHPEMLRLGMEVSNGEAVGAGVDNVIVTRVTLVSMTKNAKDASP